MKRSGRTGWSLWSGLVALFALLLVLPVGIATAQEEMDDMEWDPTWGYHEEEWYDPSDWLDVDAGVEYEDTWGWGYDANYWDEDDYYVEDMYEDEWYDYDATWGGYDEDEWGLGWDDNYYMNDREYDYSYDYYTDDWYNDEYEADWWEEPYEEDWYEL